MLRTKGIKLLKLVKDFVCAVLDKRIDEKEMDVLINDVQDLLKKVPGTISAKPTQKTGKK